MKITGKLGLLVGLPLVAVVAFAALAVATTGGQALQADGLRRLVDAGAAAGELVARSQLERAGAVLVLTGGSVEPGRFGELAAATDRAAVRYGRAREALPALPAGTEAVLTRADGQLGLLDGVREGVASGSGRASATAFAYRILIADLIGFRELVGQAGGAPADVADRLRAASALSRAVEAVGLQQVAVLRAAGYGPLTTAGAREVTAARTGQVEALQTFDAFATPSWRALLEASAAGDEPLAALQLEDQVARTAVGERLDVDQAGWAQAMSTRMGALRQVEAAVDADLLAEVGRLRDARRLAAGAQILGVVAVVAGALVLAWVLGRPVVRGLRRLRDAAHRVAHHDLPAAVAAMEQRAGPGGLDPDQLAVGAAAAVPVRGRDELAEVGEAFNRVHLAAVRTAAEQAQQRLHTAQIMLALARRGQKLTGRLTAALDVVERDELDPRRLAQLYDLDLTATLLGGTNESLLVLGGGGTAVVRGSDEPLSRVLHAAQGRVEAYQRVELGVVDDGVSVRADVVDDVVKLLAELVDNACQFSPPSAPVQVSARWMADRVVVQVVDQGPGIDPGRRAELNGRLASRPPLDLKAVQAMGLTVVAYIAHRHGIRVELRPGHQQLGTLAEATLPALLAAATPGRHPVAAGRPRLPATPTAVRPGGSGGGGGVPVAGARPWPSAPAGPPAPAPAMVLAPVVVGGGELLPVAGRWEPTAGATAELPIFASVPRPSHWFTHPGTVAETPTPAPAAAVSGGGQGPDTSWRTAADAGWHAAARAAQPRPVGVTHSGLPVRHPGAQLVPGGVDPAVTPGAGAAPVHEWRDPARAGSVAAAYSRGLLTGRTGHTTVLASQSVDGQGDRT